MKVLYVASECAPFVKTGGLADVIGAVPKVLEQLGASIKVLLPAYPALAKVLKGGKTVAQLGDLHSGNARLVAVRKEGLDLLLLDAPHLFDRPGNIYLDDSGRDWADNHLRFGALSAIGAKVALEGAGRWKPDVVHAHDWQAGLIPAYLRQAGKGAPPSIVTIHNIAFQGLFDASVRHTLGIGDELFTYEGAEYYGKLGFLKAGLALCDKITTVSPTYARELLTPKFGMGLEGLLQARSDDLSGILNGIDPDIWNPATDPDLVTTYSSRSLKRRGKNRTEIESRFGLTPYPGAPLFCVVSRLTRQKGLDLLLEVLPDLVERGGRLALLGSGDSDLETGFKDAADRYAGSVGVIIGYDEALSHLLQGGSDAILVPSRFEPCGLTQLYGVRYGTLPVVARTGGLADTVVDADNAAIKSRRATGVVFDPVTADGLRQAIQRACDLFDKPETWRSMVRAAMRYPVGWDGSAPQYLELYDRMTRPGTGKETR
ncbi:MAG: glycogen synthase GlgA [Hyphomicrobiales bacterium]|nr:glycogen synthase GlgA [Hyphomicrobiales bacterium]MCP4999086.1 glycogen synthase GlgA [Hyphomicrobiales bacterium]